MRIAMVTNNYKPFVGGVPVSVERLTLALRRRGHTVTVFAPSYGEDAPEAGVVRFRARKKRLTSGIVVPDMFDPMIARAIQAGGYDLVHLHHPMLAGYTGLYAAKRGAIPTAFTYHTRYEQYLHHIKAYSTLDRHARADGKGICAAACSALQRAVPAHNRLFMNRCDMVFAPTPLMREYLLENGAAGTVRVLPTGLADEDFCDDPVLVKRLKERYAPDGRPLVCTVSRLEKEKNIPFLLRAMARLHARSPFRLLVIGEGTCREAFYAQAKELGLDVAFTGGVPHEMLSSYYRACELFVFASKSETQGIVLLEAMAMGLPVVAVDASGVCDVVADGVNGYMVPENEAAFAAQAQRVLENAVLRRRLGGGAHMTAGRFTADRMAAEAEAGYAYTIMKRRPGYEKELAHAFSHSHIS